MIACAVIMASLCFESVSATGNADGKLFGIGYREQELQVAKGLNFASESATGVKWASYAGGTNIFIKGDRLSDDPQSNTVVMKSVEFDMEVVAPRLTEDDAFASNPILGTIAYRVPSLEKLYGLPMSFFDQYQTMTFIISIIALDPDLGPITLRCPTESNC